MKNKENKRGLSAVVSSLIIVAMVISISAIVWIFVDRTIKGETESSSACFNSFGKVYMNNQYTCYNSGDNKLKIGIGLKDIDVDSVLVSISGEDASKSFEIPPKNKLGYIKMYDGTEDIYLPDKNSGLTYIIDLGIFGIGVPQSIKIAPIVKGHPCEASDVMNGIENCLSIPN